MASALQCPSCGTKTRLDSQAAGETFSCERCGQPLKVPARRGARGSSAPAPAASGKAPNQGSGAPPAPRRRARPVMTAGGGVAAGGTAVLAPPVPAPGSGANAGGPVASRPLGRNQGSDGPRAQLALPWRIGAWLIALPLGLVIVGLPSRKLGFLSSQKLLDVIVKRDISRFVPLLIIIALWALVSAVLVTAIIEFARRRRGRRGSDGADGGGGGRRAKRQDGLAGLGAAGVGAPSGASTGGASAGPTPPPRRRGRPG